MEMQSYNIFSSRQLLVVRRVYGEYVVKTFVEKKAFFSDFGFNWIGQEVILYLLVVIVESFWDLGVYWKSIIG